VIDGGTAALLALFAAPRTIAEAVDENSRALGVDSRKRAEEVLPYLAALVRRGDLVAPGVDEGPELRPQFDDGSELAGWMIVRCVRAVDDSEIYEVRDGNRTAALKVARAVTPAVRTLFRNEAAILRHLDGSGIAPRLIAAGSSHILMEWVPGVDALTAAEQRRDDRAALLRLCLEIVRAYAALHDRGVLHGDVHPRNIVVGDGITLLDFGHARVDGRAPRAGIIYFFAPDPPSPAAEQYALAALLYLMIAGNHYLEFRLEREEIERQIARDAPLPFAAHGVAPWPEVERVLFRALRKNPERRYRSVATMAAALYKCTLAPLAGRGWPKAGCGATLGRVAPLIRRFAAPSPRARGEGRITLGACVSLCSCCSPPPPRRIRR
jgi:serine/threonine-protein kinase